MNQQDQPHDHPRSVSYLPAEGTKSHTFKNRMLWVLGGLGVLLILSCAGFTALGMIVSPADSKAAASQSTPSSAPTTPVAATMAVAEVVLPPTEAPTAAPKARIPDLKGQNAAVADDALQKAGFTNIEYGSQDEYHTVVLLLANWTVTKQPIKPGSTVSTDTLIVLACTKEH